jgi:hypothetical protein
MAWEIRPRRQDELETVADDLAWVIWEAQKVFGKTEHMFVIPSLLAEVGIKFSDKGAA